MSQRLHTAAVSGENSLGFLRTVFALYAEGEVFAVTREDLDLAAYPGLEAVRRIEVGADRGWATLAHRPSRSPDPAQIVFSSGTEGRPKAIVLSHRNVGDVVERLNAAMRLDGDVREYIGVPVTYSFGLGRARAVSAAGGAIFLPERFDPAEIGDMLRRGEINAISAVPSLWRIVLRHAEVIGHAGRGVRWIEIGSQYMSADEKRAMRRLFPEARIVQHYGLTEASRTTFLDITEAREADLETVGRPTGSAAVRIGAEGEICIRGDHVALGILDDRGGIAPITDAEGWLHTSDGGALTPEGLLVYRGRLDDQINVAGRKIAAEALEREIRGLVTVPAEHYAIASIPDPLRGDAVLLAISAEAGAEAALVECAANSVLARHGLSRQGGVEVLRVDRLPRTGTGKIQRKRLRERYLAAAEAEAEAAGPAAAPGAAGAPGSAEEDGSPAERRVRAAWRSVFGEIPIPPDQSFHDLGGDSLSAMQVSLAMDRVFRPEAVRATLEGRPLREVARIEEGRMPPPEEAARIAEAPPRRATEAWAINSVRGLMVLAVLLSHWGPGAFDHLGVAEAAERWLSLIYRMGTPGFAAAFGLGIGYYYLSGFPANRLLVRRRLFIASALVLCGLVLTALGKMARDMLAEDPIVPGGAAEAFSDVLMFYFLALASMIVWLALLSRGKRVLAATVALAIGFWLTYLVAREMLAAEPLDAAHRWLVTNLVGKYGYLKLSGVVLCGMAAGLALRQSRDPVAASERLLVLGSLGAAGCLLAAAEVFGLGALTWEDAVFFDTLLGAGFYIGVVVGLLGLMLKVTAAWWALPAAARAVTRIVIVIGGLALPIYVFHIVASPVSRDILVVLGVPPAAALAIPMGLFFAAMGYLGWRLHCSYFGARPDASPGPLAADAGLPPGARQPAR
jgi:hypothetical protein